MILLVTLAFLHTRHHIRWMESLASNFDYDPSEVMLTVR